MRIGLTWKQTFYLTLTVILVDEKLGLYQVNFINKLYQCVCSEIIGFKK